MAIAIVAEYEEGVTILSDECGRFAITKDSDSMIHLPDVKTQMNLIPYRTMDKLPFSLYTPMNSEEVQRMMS